MENIVSVSGEDLAKIQELQSTYVELMKRFGELHFQAKAIQQELASIEVNVETLDNERLSLYTDLQKKYGVGTIDMTTGQFIPEPEKVIDRTIPEK